MQKLCALIIIVILCFLVYHYYIQNKFDALSMNIKGIEYDLDKAYQDIYHFCSKGLEK